jgi:hypothetical protein
MGEKRLNQGGAGSLELEFEAAQDVGGGGEIGAGRLGFQFGVEPAHGGGSHGAAAALQGVADPSYSVGVGAVEGGVQICDSGGDVIDKGVKELSHSVVAEAEFPQGGDRVRVEHVKAFS